MHFFLFSNLRPLLPFATVVLTMMASLVLSVRFPLTAAFVPLFAIHYWSVPQPLFMPSGLVFALGIGQDLLVATPLGLHAFVWIAFYACVRSSAFAVQGGRIPALTLHYALLSLSVPLVLVVLSLLQGRGFAGGGEVLWGWLGACGFYPFVALLLKAMERNLLDAS